MKIERHIPAVSKEYLSAMIPATVGAMSSPVNILILNLRFYGFFYKADAIFAH